MALTKEDGSIVANADTYASAADLATFVTEITKDTSTPEFTLPSTDAEKEALLTRAMLEMAQYRGRWKGDRVSSDQELDWPRSSVWVDGINLPSDEIPREIFYGQMMLALSYIDRALFPVNNENTKGPVIEETVHGAVTRRYANPGRVEQVSAYAPAEVQFRVLFRHSGLQSIRV